jgi:hypothetical protein
MGKNGPSAASSYRKPLSLKQPRQVCKKGSNIGASTAATDTTGKENAYRYVNTGSGKVADKDQHKDEAEQKYSTVADREEHRKRIEAAVAAYHAERMATEHRCHHSDENPVIEPLCTTTQKSTSCRSSNLWFVFSVSLVVVVVVWSALRVIMLQRPAYVSSAAHSVVSSELLQSVRDVEISRWVTLPEEPQVVSRVLLPSNQSTDPAEESVSDAAREITVIIISETPQPAERVVDESLLLVKRPADSKVGQQFQMVAVKFRAALAPFRRAVELVKTAAARWMHRVFSLFKRK